MIFIYLLIGIVASIVSALPLGASNIAVINTTLKQNARQAFKIAIWVQVVIAVVLFGLGVFLLLKKQSDKPQKEKRFKLSKYITGFVLGLLNPPVLIYWVVVYGVINSGNFMLSLQSSVSVLFLFFVGVYIGKLLTLYFYSKLSVLLSKKLNAITSTINRVLGVLLIAIGVLQYLKIYIL